jgi:hypothetical protein
MWLFGKQRRSGSAARHSSRRFLRRNQLSRSGGLLERLEDRRLLAITANFAGGVLSFIGDTGNNQLTITASDSTSNTVSFTSATDVITLVGATNPQAGVTTIIVSLNGGTNDSLTINGSPDADTIAVNGLIVTFGAVPYSLADVENLTINCQDNNDTVSATGLSVSGALAFSGGAGTDALSATGPLTVGSLSVVDPESDDVELTGIITTSGALGQNYGTAVTLVGNTDLVAGAGDINLAQQVNGPAFDFRPNSSGSTIFNGAVNVGGLTTLGGGQTKMNVADPLVAVTTVGNQIYNNPVLLLQDTILTSTTGGIFFEGGVDAADNAAAGSDFGLTVNTPVGNNFINSEIGGDNQDAFAMVSDEHGLQFLVTDATGVSGQTQIDVAGPLVAVLTSGNQEYNDPLLLRQDTILTSSGGNITFDNFVDALNNLVAGTSDFGLTVNTPAGNNLFNFEVGGDNQDALLAPSDEDGLEFLTTDATGAGGQTQLNIAAPLIAVMTTGDQTYNDAVALGANTILIGNDISFNSTIDSSGVNRDLDVRTTGAGVTTFGGQVGVVLPLANLTTNLDGATVLSAGVINTTIDQTYNDPVLLVGVDTTLAASSGNITFNNVIDADNDGSAGTSNLGLTVNTPNLTAVAGKGNNVFNAEVGGNNLVGDADPDGLEFLTTDNTGAAGQTRFNFAAGPNTVLTTLNQTYNDPVLLTFDTVLTSSAGDITFNNFVDARNNALAATSDFFLEVNTPAGNNIFNGEVGGNNQTDADPDGLERLQTDTFAVNGGQTKFNVADPSVAVLTFLGQDYNDAVLLMQDTILTSTGASITFSDFVDAADNTVGGTSDFGLTLNTPSVFGSVFFSAEVGGDNQDGLSMVSDIDGLEFLTTDLTGGVGGQTNFDVADPLVAVLTVGNQQYNDPVLLRRDTILTSSGGNITFNTFVDAFNNAAPGVSDFGLTVNTPAGNNVFNAEVGGDNVAALMLSDPDGLEFLTTDATGVGGRTELNNAVVSTMVTTDLSQTYNDAVSLNAADNTTTLLAGDDVTFNSTVDGSAADVESLVVDASDDTSLNGSVGTLGRLVDLTINKNDAGNPGETTFLRGAVIMTQDDQQYNERVELNAVANLVTLIASGGDMVFASTVDSEVADQDGLSAQAGTFVRFDGNVGVAKRLESLFAEALTDDVEFRRIDALNTVELDADADPSGTVEDLDASAADLDVRAAALIARSRTGINLDTEIGSLTALNSGPAGDPGNATSFISIREANALDVLSVINNAATGGDVAIITGGNVMSIFNVSAIGFFIGAVTENNTPAQDDDILVFGSIITGGAISMQAGDDMILGVGSDVESLNSFIYMNIDSASADAAGGTAILAGDIEADSAFQYPIFVQGGAGDDLFSLQKLPLSPIALAAEGGALDNAFILTTDAAEQVNVFATIVDIVGRPLITYVNNEQLDLVTLGGDDRVFVQMPEPTHGALANIVRTSTGAGDDSLKINGSTLADTIRINDYTTDGNYRFQVRGDTGETECLQVFGFTGNDIIENSAHIASLLDGGNGNDHITGSDFANVFDASTGSLREIYDVIFGGADADSFVDSGRPGLSGRGGNDFLYADHDYNNGAPVQLIADGDFVNGGTGRDVIVALGADTLQRDAGDFEADIVVGQGLNLTTNDFLFAQFLPPNAGNINAQLQRGLDKKCAMPIP